jgi:solute carrier family 25 folate transporter 32
VCISYESNAKHVTASLDGLSTIVRTEGALGLFRGTSLALVGVSNGAIQFVAYEKMKTWGFDRKRRQYQKTGREWNIEADKLVRCTLDSLLVHVGKRSAQSNVAYTFMSISSKLAALTLTYPYQVVRSRIQVCLLRSHNVSLTLRSPG